MRVETDPFAAEVELRRGRRKSVELALEKGHLVARLPNRMSEARWRPIVKELRARLWESLQQRYVFDEARLSALGAEVARRHLHDLILPPWTVRFSKRQKRRWGSCTVDAGEGRIRISERLRGQPNWVVEHLLLHELIHLRVFDHGAQFQAYLARDPHRERARGYLEALETFDMHGPVFLDDLRVQLEVEEEPPELADVGLPLFGREESA